MDKLLDPRASCYQAPCFSSVDGLYSPDHSSLGALPEGVLVQPLDSIFQRSAKERSAYLGQFLHQSEQAVLEQQEGGLLKHGVLMYIPAGVEIQQPLCCLARYLAGEGSLPSIHSLCLVVAESRSSLSVCQYFQGRDEVVYDRTQTTFLLARQGAAIRYYKFQAEGNKARHRETQIVMQQRHSEVTVVSIDIGSQVGSQRARIMLWRQEPPVESPAPPSRCPASRGAARRGSSRPC